MTATRIADEYGNVWQYHSRSDRHSKVACWAVFFDLLQTSSLLRRHVTDRKVVFGVNHTMRDFKTRRKKDLDLVIARPDEVEITGSRDTLLTLADRYGIVLDDEQRSRLELLPLACRGTVGSVLVALEAKACMAAHVKAKPRLHDELSSSHLTIHGATEQAAAAAFVMINASDEFISPTMNRYALAEHAPTVNVTRNVESVVAGVIDKVAEIPRRSGTGEQGFDAVGIVVVKCRNDMGEIEVWNQPPAPARSDDFYYENLIRRLGHIYDTRYANI